MWPVSLHSKYYSLDVSARQAQYGEVILKSILSFFLYVFRVRGDRSQVRKVIVLFFFFFFGGGIKIASSNFLHCHLKINYIIRERHMASKSNTLAVK